MRTIVIRQQQYLMLSTNGYDYGFLIVCEYHFFFVHILFDYHHHHHHQVMIATKTTIYLVHK